MLKNAEDEVKRHGARAEELQEAIADRSMTLAGAISRLTAARATELPTDPTMITHDLIERHLNNLVELVAAGIQFSDSFSALANDMTNTTRALSQLLMGNIDVEMANPEGDEDPQEDYSSESIDQEGDTYRMYSDMD